VRRVLRTLIMLMVVVGLASSFAFSQDVEKGKALFNNPSFAGGKNACNSCHPNGRGLERAGAKTGFNVTGKTQNSIEEAVNFCIVNASKGKAIPLDSQEMKDLVAYIKSLGGGTGPGYGKPQR
jgi:cytochrome c